MLTHQLLNVPPGGNADIALRTFCHVLRVRLAEGFLVNQPLGKPVVEVFQRGAVIVVIAHKVDGAVRLEQQVGANIVCPVGKTEPRIEDVLPPAPLVDAE